MALPELVLDDMEDNINELWLLLMQLVPEDPRLSKWTLSTEQFGRTWEFSWLAENLTPIKQQKIHWRSVQVSSKDHAV